MSTLSFMGDIHGRLDFIFQWQYRNEQSFLIQVGDFGIGFPDTEQRLDRLNTVLSQKGNTVYVVRGNHDDPSWFNNSTHRVFTHIKFVEDGTVLEILGKKILCVGGGISIDRSHRKPGKSYWVGEEMEYDDQVEAILPNNDIDIVVTHVMKNDVHALAKSALVDEWVAEDKLLRGDLDKEQVEFGKLHDTLTAHIRGMWKPKRRLWFYGHYHKSLRMQDEYFSYIGLDIGETYWLMTP